MTALGQRTVRLTMHTGHGFTDGSVKKDKDGFAKCLLVASSITRVGAGLKPIALAESESAGELLGDPESHGIRLGGNCFRIHSSCAVVIEESPDRRIGIFGQPV